MKTRDFLMKPQQYPNSHINLAGWFTCEYKHGLHCFWDGGISRGELLRDIPWAHTPTPVSDRTISTGIWSYNLAPIPATDSWLNKLPAVFLEGVIYKEEGVKYFGATASPSPAVIFNDGVLNLFNKTKLKFNRERNLKWLKTRRDTVIPHLETLPIATRFDLELEFLALKLSSYGTPCHLLRHRQLPKTGVKEAINYELTNNPNGITLRSPESFWNPTKTGNYLLRI